MKHNLSILLLLLAFNSSYSCDCAMYPIAYYINKVDLIFTGKVVEILIQIDSTEFINPPKDKTFYEGHGYTAKVQVLERLKTGLLKKDTLEFTSEGSNCDPLYELGQTYLFFADKTKDRKYMMTHCTWWGTLNESTQNVDKLRKVLKK